VSFARGAAPVATPVIAREALAAARPGPLVVEGYDSTVVVPPGATVAPDPWGNLVIALPDGGRPGVSARGGSPA
jgi:N-methylhydantoinase A